jgi:hypothetical protein
MAICQIEGLLIVGLPLMVYDLRTGSCFDFDPEEISLKLQPTGPPSPSGKE